MTKEQKDLLLRDLCARLPYFTKVQIKNEIVVLDSICDDDGYHFNFIGDDGEGVNIENIKPYLFPLSSMTEEQKRFIKNKICYDWDIDDHPYSLWAFCIDIGDVDELIDWFNENHFDYRGLIPMGIANDATGLNIYAQ